MRASLAQRVAYHRSWSVAARGRGLPTNTTRGFASSFASGGPAGGGGDGGNGGSDALFADTDTAFASKTLPQLLRGILVFKVCGVRAFVTRADELVSLSNRVFGTRLTEAVTKATFFGHFCGGESEPVGS